MVAKVSYRHLILLLTVLGVGAVIAMAAWAVDKSQNRDSLGPAISQSNISHHRDDRVRFVPDNLFGADFVDESYGWVAGYYGTILKTENGGENWIHNSLPNTDLIRRIQFLDKDHGWLVTHRGRIMSSEDGGASWNTRHTEDNQVNLRNIRFFTPDTGWAIGHEGTILYTNDGGETWANQRLRNFTGRDLPRLNGLTVLSETHALLAGEFGVIAETVDAGQNWLIISPPEIKATFTEIERVGDFVFAVGLDGVVALVKAQNNAIDNLVETGPSARVELLESGVNAHLFDIASNGNGEGVIVGLANILTINNGGELSRIEIGRPDRNYLYFTGATAISESNYILVGARGLAVKIDTSTAQLTDLVRW